MVVTVVKPHDVGTVTEIVLNHRRHEKPCAPGHSKSRTDYANLNLLNLVSHKVSELEKSKRLNLPSQKMDLLARAECVTRIWGHMLTAFRKQKTFRALCNDADIPYPVVVFVLPKMSKLRNNRNAWTLLVVHALKFTSVNITCNH